MKNVIISGGAGFIGSWLIEELLENNVAVTVIVRDKTKLLHRYLDDSKITIVEKDISELETDDFKLCSYDAFFHLAWGGVSSENKEDIVIQMNNIRVAIDAIDLCAKVNCKKFIVSGTVAEYALCNDVMDLTTKQTPNDIYGAAKVSTYYFLEVKARQLNLDYIWMIIPSTFGERRNDKNIISYTINSLLQRQKPKYGDLLQLWDFLYVKDVVRAIRLIGEKGIPGKVYGIGSGVYRPLKEYIYIIRDLIDPTLPLGIGECPSLSQKAYASCVDIGELTKDTGFVPKISFEEGIIKTISFQKDIMTNSNKTFFYLH